MEQKLALVNCIALQYNDNNLPVAERTNHSNLIKKVCSLIKLPSLAADGDDRSALIAIRQLTIDIADNKIVFDVKMMLQRLRIICSYDIDLYKIFEEIFIPPESDEKDKAKKEQDIKLQTLRNCNNYVNILRLFNNRVETRRLITKASFALNDDTGELSEFDIVGELRKELDNVSLSNSGGGECDGFVDRVMSDDEDGMNRVLESTKRQLEGATLKSGWLGINRMLGCNGGFVPGENWVMPALPHNAKTTFSLSAFLSFGVFNDPKDFVDSSKTPLMLDISLENELNVNIPIAYQMLYGHFENEAVNIKDLDPKAAAKYTIGKLSEKGWTYSFERFTSSQFTIEVLQRIIMDYESKGYQIVALRIDYLGVSNKKDLSNGTAGSEVREMYRRTRNLTAPKKILMLSPHQLSPAAKQFKAMNPNYVKDLPGKGYYDGCTTVDNEVDGELYFGIRDQNGFSYVEVQRGKHRTIVDTPIAHRYRVLKFSDVGVLPWDLDKEKESTFPSINSDAMSQESEEMFSF